MHVCKVRITLCFHFACALTCSGTRLVCAHVCVCTSAEWYASIIARSAVCIACVSLLGVWQLHWADPPVPDSDSLVPGTCQRHHTCPQALEPSRCLGNNAAISSLLQACHRASRDPLWRLGRPPRISQIRTNLNGKSQNNLAQEEGDNKVWWRPCKS